MDVDELIIREVLPRCYQIINDMLAESKHSKELTRKARDILPQQYEQSWQGISRR